MIAARAPAHRAPVSIDGLRVVSVGNLAVGGTGKTPVAAWIAGMMRQAGMPTAVLVGSHGADEAALHRAWNPDVRVFCDRDRAAAARRARSEGVRVVVLDDGFQHRALARDLDIVLLSADDPDPAPLLPRGPYREPRSALARAGVVVVTRRVAGVDRARALAGSVDRDALGRGVACVRLAPGAWRHLDGSPAEPPRGDVLAVCGVARPEAFRRAVAECVEGDVELESFADHHAYSVADAERLARRAGSRPVVVTEKDAAKLVTLGASLGRVLVLADALVWDWGEEALRTRVMGLVTGGAGR
jgi:tetraacyldisaccharide 4'-kinase